MISPSAVVCSATDPLHIGHFEFKSSGQKVDSNPGQVDGRRLPDCICFVPTSECQLILWSWSATSVWQVKASADPWESRLVVWESRDKPKCKEQIFATMKWFLFASTTFLGRRVIELLQLGMTAFVWIGTDPHAKRISRHVWSDVLMLNGDEE